MDDLFSKAGRHYPLKTDGADWEAVARQLSSGDNPPPEKPKNGSGYGWLSILIIPILFFAIKKADLLSGKSGQKQQTENTAVKSNKISDQGSVAKVAQGETAQNTEASENTNEVAETNAQISRKPDINNDQHIATPPNQSEKNVKDEVLTQPSKPSSRTTKLTTIDNAGSLVIADRLTHKRSLTSKRKEDAGLRSRLGNAVSGKTNLSNADAETAAENQTTPILNHLNEAKKEYAAEQSAIKNKAFGSEFKNSQDAELFGRLLKFGPMWNKSIGDRDGLFNSDSILAKPYQQLPARAGLLPDGYFYYGVSFAPDLSSVKWQSVKNIGYNVGLIVGYHFANRLSVEGGFLWDRKKYYSDGKYFDKAKAGFPSYVHVKSVDGGCDMFEIPIALRYDFSYKPSTFFASVGFNSYLMKKEQYDYNAYVMGSGGYLGHRTYKNSGNNWLAGLSLSAGYSLKIARNTNIRFEPFYKIPLKKIGTGNMPLTSTGINLSLVQRIP